SWDDRNGADRALSLFSRNAHQRLDLLSPVRGRWHFVPADQELERGIRPGLDRMEQAETGCLQRHSPGKSSVGVELQIQFHVRIWCDPSAGQGIFCQRWLSLQREFESRPTLQSNHPGR